MTHSELVVRAVRWLRNTKHCRAILDERYTHGRLGECPDAIGWKATHSYLVEAKASLSDFRADKNKPHRRSQDILGAMGSFRWFIVPADAPWLDIVKAELPANWGLLTAADRGVRELVKSGQHMNVRLRDELALLISWLHVYQVTKGHVSPLPRPLTSQQERERRARIERERAEARQIMDGILGASDALASRHARRTER